MQRPQRNGIYVLTPRQVHRERLRALADRKRGETTIVDKVRDTYEQSDKEPNKAPSGAAPTQSDGEARANHLNDDREGTESTQREGSR
jgi:hypothetical protein